MAQWFKRPKEYPISISFDREGLEKQLVNRFEQLYEYRSEQGFRLLLSQISTARNIHVLSMSDVKPDQHASHNIAEIKGAIKALEWFEKTLNTTFKAAKKAQESKDAKEEASYSTKITRKRAQRARPSI